MADITTKEAAAILGVTPRRVRQISTEMGLGTDLSPRLRVFTKGDVRKMDRRRKRRGPVPRASWNARS